MLPADLTGEGPDMGVAEAVLGRLADGELVIIDGGMGSQLQAEGVPMDGVAWSARANLDHPDAVQRVHEEFIRAGAEVIIANTFAASRAGLEPRRHARGPAGPPGRRLRPRCGGGLDVIVLPHRHGCGSTWQSVKQPGR
jgi:Homocysteine S-methyltransferase